MWDSILSKKFVFCDVGARGGLEEPWSLHKDNLSIVAFEPDQSEAKTLSNSLTVINKALSSKKEERDLYLLRSRGCSSFLKPNFNFLNSFPESDRYEIELNQKVFEDR